MHEHEEGAARVGRAQGLTVHQNVNPLPAGRVLLVACTYRGGDRDRSGGSGVWAQWNGHRILHRNFYANPRSPAYLAALIGELADRLAPARCELVLDARWRDRFHFTDLPLAQPVGAVDLAEPRWARMGDGSPPDAIILCYRDALGLGCSAIERGALRQSPAVFVLNGRRRLFRLDGAMRRRLAARRWLANSRAVELVLAAVVIPLAAMLALLDRVRNRGERHDHG